MNIDQDIVKRQFNGIEFDELFDSLVKEIEIRNYLITKISNIDNVFNRENLDFKIGFKRYKIIEFCNLHRCAKLISANVLTGTFMPVRFVIYLRDEDGLNIAFLKPTAFARLFNSTTVATVAQTMDADMKDVLDELNL